MTNAAAQSTDVSEITYSSQLDSLEHVRTELRRRLEASSLGQSDDAVDGLLLASVEAIANVIEHAHQHDGRAARVEVQADESQVEVRIYSTGASPRPDVTTPTLPDPLAEGGRGLFLIDALTDASSYGPAQGGGHVLRLMKRVAEVSS